MPIRVGPNEIDSKHWFSFKTNEKVNGHDVYFMTVSGVAKFSFKGESSNWHYDDLYISAPLPVEGIALPPKPNPYDIPKFKCKGWVVFATMNSVFNKDRAVNSGHAVDSFRLNNPNGIIKSGVIEAKIAVRDRDAYLYRVGYKLDLLIYFDGFEAPPD